MGFVWLSVISNGVRLPGLPTIAELTYFNLTQKSELFLPGDPPLRCSARPRALAGVLPKDLRMAAGDHHLLTIHSAHEQFSDGTAITVAGDPAKADRLADHHGLKVITGSPGPLRLSPIPSHFWGVDAGQPDLFTGCGSAGVAVVAPADGDGFQGSSRTAKHQQQAS